MCGGRKVWMWRCRCVEVGRCGCGGGSVEVGRCGCGGGSVEVGRCGCGGGSVWR